jgi:hypothetical protein
MFPDWADKEKIAKKTQDLINVEELEAFIKAARELHEKRADYIERGMTEALDIALTYAKAERYEKALRELTGPEYGFKAQNRAKAALEGRDNDIR